MPAIPRKTLPLTKTQLMNKVWVCPECGSRHYGYREDKCLNTKCPQFGGQKLAEATSKVKIKRR